MGTTRRMLLQGLVIGTAGMALRTQTALQGDALQGDAEHGATSGQSLNQHDANAQYTNAQWPSAFGYAMACCSAAEPA